MLIVLGVIDVGNASLGPTQGSSFVAPKDGPPHILLLPLPLLFVPPARPNSCFDAPGEVGSVYVALENRLMSTKATFGMSSPEGGKLLDPVPCTFSVLEAVGTLTTGVLFNNWWPIYLPEHHQHQDRISNILCKSVRIITQCINESDVAV